MYLGMKTITLSNNGIAVVDDEDYDWLSVYKWSHNGIGYIQSWINKRVVLMHRLIMNAQPGQELDHINRVKHDNQRHNLRFVSRTENMNNMPYIDYSTAFQGTRKGATSEYIGVCYCQNLWRSSCKRGSVRLCTTHKTEKEAALAYDDKARMLYGENAKVNFPTFTNGSPHSRLR